MATNTRNPGIQGFFGDVNSAEALQKHFIEAPFDGAQQPLVGSLLELAGLLNVLPQAFIGSQQRELTRLKRDGEGNESRIAILEASIDRAEAIQAMAQLGQARAQRSAVAQTSNRDIFHGFVSDANMTPLAGLRVRVIDSRKAGAADLTATTGQDGYFMIALKTKTPQESGKVSHTSVSRRVIDFFSANDQVRGQNAVAPPPDATGQVEVMQKERVLYTDPVPLQLEQGSTYREYVISADPGPGADTSYYPKEAKSGNGGKKPAARKPAAKTKGKSKKSDA